MRVRSASAWHLHLVLVAEAACQPSSREHAPMLAEADPGEPVDASARARSHEAVATSTVDASTAPEVERAEVHEVEAKPKPETDLEALAGPWSESVRGLRGRLRVSIGEPFRGTPMVRVELELQYVSDVANPKPLFWDVDKLFEFHLEDESGNSVETGPMAASIARPRPYWLMIPNDSTLRMNITTYGYGVYEDSRLFIGVPGMKAWSIPREDQRRLWLRATFTVPASPEDRRAWHGTLELPRVEVH